MEEKIGNLLEERTHLIDAEKRLVSGNFVNTGYYSGLSLLIKHELA